MNYPAIPLDQAEASGFIIDHHCYPWVAYKGPRFDPIEWHYVETPAVPATKVLDTAVLALPEDV